VFYPLARRYFLSRGGHHSGPFTKNELRALHIEPDTKVWNEDLYAWTVASTFDDLRDLFETLPSARIPRKGSRWAWLERLRSRRS
jgi:uncharacterized protein DUF4339